MSIQCVAWVLEYSMSTRVDRLVLLAVANHADVFGENAWPSIEQIAKEARVDRATVFRAVPRLIALGELDVYRGGGRGRHNAYRVVMKLSQDATVSGLETVAESTETVAGGDKRVAEHARHYINRPRTVLRNRPSRTRADALGREAPNPEPGKLVNKSQILRFANAHPADRKEQMNEETSS